MLAENGSIVWIAENRIGYKFVNMMKKMENFNT